ncbi:MAG: hypothetical protein ACMG6S_00030 [Byssovorax sp.]
MNAVNLLPISAGELGRRIGADLGRPSLRAVIVTTSSVGAVASRISERQRTFSGRAVTHIEHPHEAAALVRLVRGAGEGLAVISGIDDFSEKEWQWLDLLRSHLARGGSTWFVLSPRSFRLLSRNAPNLASWIDSAFTLLDGDSSPHAAEEEAAQAEFDGLSRTWLDETMFTSSLTRMINHPAYQKIIQMGPKVVPSILRDLEREPKMWGPALHAITKATPVPREDAGKVRRVAAAWLKWAKDNGYEW